MPVCVRAGVKTPLLFIFDPKIVASQIVRDIISYANNEKLGDVRSKYGKHRLSRLYGIIRLFRKLWL
jgi:hypothetical protein